MLVIFVKVLTNLGSLIRGSLIGIEGNITSEALKGMTYIRQVYLICDSDFAMNFGKKKGNILFSGGSHFEEWSHPTCIPNP